MSMYGLCTTFIILYRTGGLGVSLSEPGSLESTMKAKVYLGVGNEL